MLADTINFIGDFTISEYNAKDELLASYSDKNLIMDAARKNMAELIAGLANGKVINRFILGTRGHVGTDLLVPKEVGGSYTEGNFDSSRLKLYSEEAPAGTPYWYVDFTPNPLGGNSTISNVFNTVNGLETITDVNVSIGVAGKETTYTVTIPVSSANKTTGPVAYTEAGLVSVSGGDVDLFSMKCFPARVKEDTVKLIIVWKIIF
jgi:hypothetical protein